MSIPPNQYPEEFKEDIFVNFCHDDSALSERSQHYHNLHYEICFVLKGKTTYFFNFSKHVISKHNVIFINKKTAHLSVDQTNEPCERIIINFSDKFLKKYSLNYHFLTEIFTNPMLEIPRERSSNFTHLLTELVYESDYPSSFSSHLVSANVYKLLVNLYRIATGSNLSKILPTNPIIEAATKHICQNYSSNLTLESVAEYCHVSKQHLSRLFKNIMGVTFINYLITIRIHNASIMLVDTNKSIMEISEECGFNSQNHFCDTFKRIKGVSARDFRKFN